MKKLLAFLMLVTILGCGKEAEQEKVQENKEVSSNIELEKEKEEIKQEEKYLNIVEVSTVSSGKKSIEIRFSEDLDLNSDIDAYVKVNSDIPYTLVKIKNKVVITGDFNLGDTYEVEIREGLKSKDGLELKENYKTTVSFKDLEPKISFSNEGIILPGVNEKRISFRSLNVKKVNVTLKKIYENNTTQFLQEFNFKGNGNVFNYALQGEFYKIGDTILEKTYTLDSIKNKWIQTEIDLGNLADKKGFYIVELSFDEKGIDYKFPDDVENWKKYSFFENNGKIGKVVMLSDNAMVAQKTKDNIVVNVLNITDNSLVKGAKVKAITTNNQLLEEKVTDENGEVIFNNNDKIFYLLSEKGEEKSILKFDDSQLSYEGFAVDGIYSSKGVKGFLYTDRGIYRPGDKIYFSVIARSNKSIFPEGQPIKVNVYTPRGEKFIENRVIKDSKNGFYTFEIETNQDSETGLWKVEVELGGDKFQKDIPVETIVPYKIKVETKVPKEVDLSQERELKYSVKSDYLFGAPGSDLKYTSELEVREEEISFEKYKNYVFKDPTTYSFYYNDQKNGVLNKDGKGEVKFNLEKLSPSNINLTGRIVTRVLETGGRPVTNIEEVLLKKFDTYIGIENSGRDYIKSGDKLNIKVISVTNDGKELVAGRKLKYRIYRNEYSWWWDYSDYGSFLKSIKTDSNTTLISEKEFISSDKPYLIDCEINGTGEILVEVEDLATGQKTGVNLYASTCVDSSISKKIDTLKIKTDRVQYNIGDKAKIYYEGEKGARALVTVEKSGQILKRYWKDVEGIENVEEIEISEEMFPNAYVTVALFQDYENYTNDRPLRLYGAVPLMVKDDSTRLNLDILAPDEIKPNETFKVKVKNRANSKIDYTVAVVDEGLLDITGFKTPDPWKYFYQKEALQISAFDNYNEIIGKTFGEVHQVLKAGGGDFLAESLMANKSRSKQLGIEDAERFKPVVMFKGVLSTDENGEGEVEFLMPNYMGAVKVMVVGADFEKYGSAEKEILVKAPVVLNSSIPRGLKVGDELTIPVEIFALEEGIGDIKVSLEFNGEIQKEKIELKNKEKKTLFFKIKVPNKIGVEKIKISVDSSKYDHEEVTNIAIDSNSPYIYINEVKSIDSEQDFNAPEEFVSGSVNSRITISSSPILAIDERLQWLIRYPYGCVEQTTSSVFPQLFISKLSYEKNFDMKEITKNINSGIARLSRFQLNDGSFSYWLGGSDSNLWATNYVGHFLINAKDRGYYIPNDMYEKWLRYSKQQAKNYSGDIDLKAYTLYLLALAGEPDISEMNLMYENYLDKLLVPSQWYLAAAYKLSGDEKMAREIGDKLSIEIPKASYEYYSSSYGSRLKDKAIVLSAYYTIYEKIEKTLYNEIIRVLQSQEWLSTQSSAYSLLTMAEIKENKEKEELKAILEINGKTRKFISSDKDYIETLPEDIKNIKVRANDGKEIYVNYYWEGIPINYDGENISKNIKLERHYYDLNGKEQSEEFVKSLESGKSFWLEVRVLPSDDVERYFSINNVALTQVLPTGWEIENLRALNQDYPKWVAEKTEDTYIDYEDIRDDRIMWFFSFDNYDSLGKSFFVKINSVTKGKYRLPGTMAEAMYDKNYEAYLKGTEVEVK